MLASIAYAILRHRFLDITIIIRKSIIFVLLTSAVLLFYSIVIVFIQRLLWGRAGQIGFLEISSIVIVALTAAPAQRIFERLTDRYFFRAAYDSQRAIYELSKRLNTVKTLGDIDEQIGHTLTKTLKVRGVGILREDRTHAHKLAFSYRNNFKAADKHFMTEIHSVRTKLGSELETIVTDEILRKAADKPDAENALIELCQSARTNGVEVILPLTSKEHVLGFMLLAGKKSDDAYSGQDLQLLEILASSAAVAMDNAMFYEALEDRVEQRTLEVNEKNRYLMTLQRVTNQIIQSVNFKEVTQKIVDSIHSEMGYPGAFIFNVDDKDGSMALAAVSDVPAIREAISLLGIDAFEIKGSVDDNPATIRAIRDKEVVTTDKLSDILTPAVSADAAHQMQVGAKLKGFVMVPIVIENKAYGVLTFMLDKKSAGVSIAEREIMHALAHLVAIVIRNSEYYELIGASNKKLSIANQKINDQVRQLEEANFHLQKLDKSKTEFLSIASHQLRTPLSAIRGYLSLLDEGDYGTMEEQQKVVVKKVQDNVRRLVSLVNDLLSLARIEAGTGPRGLNKESVDFRLMVDQIVDEVVLKAQNKGIYLHWHRPEEPLNVMLDREKIDQVVMNLIDNAVYYTLQGGVDVHLEKRGDKVRFTVQDSGIGISKESLDQMFTKFYRSSDAIKVRPDGTGIGLYVAKIMVESHEGKIWIESEQGKGSKFIVEMPLE